METSLITTSRLRSFNACRRMHRYQYELGYRPLIDRASAEFGTIMHAGLEAWWKAYGEGRPLLALEEAQAAIAAAVGKASFNDDATSAKAELLMFGYHARWSPEMDQFEVIAVEREFKAPLPTPAGAKRARGLKIAGKLDVLVRKLADGTIWIVEHKTTSADLTPGSQYWLRLRMDTQVSVYFEGTRVLGYEPVGCLYDVISKPEQRPLKATPEDKRKYKKDGTLYAKQRAEDESMEAFKARMAEDIAANVESYFQRPEVVRLESEIEESRRDTYDTAQMIRDAKNTDRAPRNVDACWLWNRPCDFLPVCEGTASIDDPTRYRRLATVHPELALAGADSIPANANSGDPGTVHPELAPLNGQLERGESTHGR